MTNIKKTQSGLLSLYYAIYAALIVELTAAHLLACPFEVSSETGLVIRTIVVLLMLSMIPFSLKLFSVKTRYNKGIGYYARWAKIQMSLLALPAFASGLAYFILKDRNTLFCYLIAFVAIIFSKPVKAKTEQYLARPEAGDEMHKNL